MPIAQRNPHEDGEDGPEFKITGFGDLDEGGRDEVEIDLSDWGEAARNALDERLHLLQAPHTWNGSWLIIAEADEAWIDQIIDLVEDEQSVQLDPEVDQVGYDLAGWDDENRRRLLEGLDDEAIAYGLDGDELIVHEIDEQRVDELVDAILEPDAPPPAGGEARTEVMGELFVAVDRLVHDPDDNAGRKAVVDGAQEAATHAPPYGMDKEWWQRLGERCADLARLLESPARDDERVIEQATILRDLLRPYV
jgi:hypothetical protein